MKKALGLFSILLLVTLFQGCDVVDEMTTYDIVVINDSIFTLSIYLDDAFQFTVSGFSRKTIYDVSSGEHTLEATWLGVVIAQKTAYISGDTTWRLS